MVARLNNWKMSEAAVSCDFSSGKKDN